MLFPMLNVGSAIARRSAKHHHRIRRGAGLIVALDRIPQQIAGHKHIGPVGEQRGQAALDHDDIVKLPGVVGHWVAVAVGIDHVRGGSRQDAGVQRGSRESGCSHGGLRRSWRGGSGRVG